MNDYLKIANGSLLYVCGGIITVLVVLQAVLFIRHSFKEGAKYGLKNEQMFKALRTGAMVSIVPTIASLVALVAMVPVLGIPIPWIRQSIMGSTPYELLAAGIGAKAMGVESFGGQGYTAEVFSNSIWIMTLGSFWAVFIVVFFLKKIQDKYSKAIGSDSGWRNTLINASFMGVFSIFIAEPVASGGLPLMVLVSGGVIMTLLAIIILKLKQDWLREFALTLSMVGAMLLAIVFSKFFS